MAARCLKLSVRITTLKTDVCLSARAVQTHHGALCCVFSLSGIHWLTCRLHENVNLCRRHLYINQYLYVGGGCLQMGFKEGISSFFALNYDCEVHVYHYRKMTPSVLGLVPCGPHLRSVIHRATGPD